MVNMVKYQNEIESFVCKHLFLGGHLTQPSFVPQQKNIVSGQLYYYFILMDIIILTKNGIEYGLVVKIAHS